MFGYILPDKPNMYVKDYNTYRAHYCGLCKTTKKQYGNLMRLGINYDITFIDIMLHGLLDQAPTIKTGGCILNPIQKKPYVLQDEISKNMVHLNVLLTEFKIKDDLADTFSPKKKLLNILLKRKIKKARANLPDVATVLDSAFLQQQQLEIKKTPSPDMAADAFSVAIKSIYKILLGDKYTDPIGDIAYNLAKFVYIMDAIDDFEEDVGKNQYNVFRLKYPNAHTKSELIDLAGEELVQINNGIISSIKEAYEEVAITVNEGVVTNTLWFGLRSRANHIMKKECTKCQKTRF